jgi:two-component system, sensor histidine kinase PdtaS
MKLRPYLFLFLSLARCEILTAQPDSLLALAVRAPNDSIRLNHLGEAFKQTIFNDPEQGMAIAQDFLQVAQRAHNQDDIAKGLNFIGMCHYVQGRYDKATEYYLQSMKQAEANADTLYAAIVLNNIAACYEIGKQPEEAIRAFEEALKRFRRLGDKSWMAKVSHNLAQRYLAKKDLEAALLHYQQAYQWFQELGDRHHVGVALTGYGHYFFQKEQYAAALNHYQTALPMLDRQYDPAAYAEQLEYLSNTYLHLGKYKAAEQHLQTALPIVRECKALEQEVRLSQLAVTLYKQTGNIKKAFEWQEKFIFLSDSLYNQEKTQALQDAVKKYELEQKEQQITLLNTENQVKDLSLQNARRLQVMLLLGLLILSLLGLGGWYLLRLKQRSNRKLEEKNLQINKALAEKDLLLREIHHRVKNNLQIISSLLKLQSQHLSDQQALDALTEGRNRVRSMAFIHQNLYQQEQLTAIEAASYVEKLANALLVSYNFRPDDVQIRYEVDPLLLDVDTAVPIGLILNELITNALKYAFKEATPGTLTIRLRCQNPDTLMLAVQDTGSGVDPALLSSETVSASFGLRLVQLLAEKLEATISVRNENGACIELHIRQFKTAT